MPAIRHLEKLLLVVALGALLVAVAWARRHAPPPVLIPARVPTSGVAYTPTGSGMEATENPGWNQPSPQARGAEWVYELFTPPEIYYDPRSREFSVKPPVTAGPEEQSHAAPLVAPPEPFRLQLVGYVGGEGSYLGTFENLATTEHILARTGRTLPELGVTIRDFQVKRVRREPDDSMPTSELIATAVVRDERTGEDVVLTNLERAYARP